MAHIEGPIADEYRALSKKVDKALSDSDIHLHITNLGHLLHQRGIIKKPHGLFARIREDLVRAIINAKIREI